jgi:hypothetical protein
MNYFKTTHNNKKRVCKQIDINKNNTQRRRNAGSWARARFSRRKF